MNAREKFALTVFVVGTFAVLAAVAWLGSIYRHEYGPGAGIMAVPVLILAEAMVVAATFLVLFEPITKWILDCLDAGGNEMEAYWRVLTLLILLFMLEFFGSLVAGSLGIKSDAYHVAVDGASIYLAVWIAHLVKEEGFGEARIRFLGAYASAILMVLAACLILWEAWERFQAPAIINSVPMIVVAAVGWYGNKIQHEMLERLEHNGVSNITRYSASLHVFFDKWQSAAITVGGIAIWLTGHVIVDTILSVAVAAGMIYGAGRIVWEVLCSAERQRILDMRPGG